MGVFGPLKTAMGAQLSRLYAMEIARLQKVEWVDKYVPAREKAITESNMKGGWRGTGIFPWNPSRVLRTLLEITAPPSPPEVNTTTSYLISSSPPDATTL